MKKALSCFLALLIALTALGAAAEEATLTYDYDVLTVGAPTPFAGNFFNSVWGNVASDQDVRMLLHGYNLMYWRADEGRFITDPSVVSGMVVGENSEGDRAYVLTLCPDLYYSDGSKITAWDYAFSYLLGMAPQIEEIGGDLHPAEYLKGYADYISGKTKYLAGVRVISDTMLTITVDADYLPYFYEMGLLDVYPYPIKLIAPACKVQDDGQGVYIDNPGAFTADMLRKTILDETTGYLSHPKATSGPYRLVSYEKERVELEINPYFKGDADGVKPSIKRLIFNTVGNDAMIDSLKKGESMLLHKVVSADLIAQGLELADAGDTFVGSEYPRNGLCFISFCCEKPAMASQQVRQAIAMCLDKNELTKRVVGEHGIPVDGYYGVGQWMYQVITGEVEYPVIASDVDAADQTKAWEELNLDGIKAYALDEEQAAKLLEQDGWTLNRQGEAFRAGEDDVRCKKIGDEIVPLELTLLCMQESIVPPHIEETFSPHLAKAGIVLNIERKPMEEVMKLYYRQEQRDCDMILLASNFELVFDPSTNFRPDEDGVNVYNTSAIADEELYRLAAALRNTQPGDMLEYCKRWIKMQERFSEVLPVLPIYSNTYFDFYPRVLQNYAIQDNITWGQAVNGAWLGDAPDQ